MPENITQQMDMVTSTPQEAAQHIDNANAFGITPDVFKDYKSQLQPEVDKMQRPTQTTPVVARYVAQSPEHAAVASEDVPKLGWMESQIRLIGDHINKRRTTEEQISDLSLKKMFSPDQWTMDDDLKLDRLNTDASEFSNYGLDGPYEQLPAQVAGGIASMVTGAYKHADLIAGSAATGAGIGALTAGPAGAIAGATTGLGYGLIAANTLDSTKTQIGATYNELSKLKGEDGKPPKFLDEDTKKYIAMGVGISSGAIAGLVGNTVMKATPFLSKLISPKMVSAIVMDPANAALKATLFNIGKSAFASGAGASMQKAIDVIGQEVGKLTGSGEAITAEGLNNALANASGEIAKSGLVGSATGLAISAPLGALGYGQTKKGFIRADEQRFTNARDITPEAPLMLSDIPPKQPKGGGSGSPAVDAAIDVLHFDSALDQINKVQNSTEMKKLSPSELSKVRKDMLDNADIKTVYLDKEELTKWANNEEKAKAVRDILSDKGQSDAAINAPIQTEAHKFMELVDNYPDASELAKLNPEGPSTLQAQVFLKQHNDAQAKQKEILTKLGVGDISPEAKATLEQALQTEQPSRIYPSNDVFGEAEYLNQPTFTKAIESVLPEKEVASYNEAQNKARQSVVDNINEASKYEMDQIRDFTLEQAREIEFENQLSRLENNPNLALVDRFLKPEESFADLTVNHKKKGFSAFAIDPQSLPGDVLAKYIDNPQLKKHKVFVKGGIPAQDAAALLGTRDAETLLQVLSQTPSREDVARSRVAAREADLQRLSTDSVDLNKTALSHAYDNVTANHIAEMKFMREKEWPATKTGIKRIALPLPTLKGLSEKAKVAVGNTKIGELNVNQFKVGERKSQRIAVDSILKNQVEKAFTNKEAAALNVQLAKETGIAIGKVNRALRFVRSLESKENIQVLKDAGKLYENAADELLTNFNFRAKRDDTAEQGSFIKWVERKVNEGEGDFQIPDRFTDIRQSVNDLTVDQVLAISDSLKTILHQAKFKNKLYDKRQKINGLKTMEAIGNKIEKIATEHPNYDAKRSVILSESSKSKLQKADKKLMEFKNITERAQHIIARFDQSPVGLLNDLVFRPIADAGDEEIHLNLETKNHMIKMIEKFGKDDFNNLATERVTVPEFKSIKTHKDGSFTKLELLAMELNFGNAGNKEVLERFGVSKETIRSVLDRELEHRHTEFAQNIWNMLETFKPKIQELEKRTTGVDDVKWVQAEEFTARGRVYPGGYYPIINVFDEVRTSAENTISAAELTNTDKFLQKYYAKEMTDQGHLLSRTENDRLLDLDFNRFMGRLAQITHDLTFREATRDVQKVLTDKKIRDNIVNVVGPDNYTNVLDMVNDSATLLETGDKTDRTIQGALNYLKGGIQTVAIAGKLSSIAIQPASIAFAINRMGNVKGTLYFSKTLAEISSQPWKIGEISKWAEDIYPSLKAHREDLSNNYTVAFSELTPKEKNKYLDPVTKSRDWVIEKSFAALGQVDAFNKVLVLRTAYKMAINGEVEGIKMGDHDGAVKYASNITELTQTTNNIRNLSPIQKKKYANWAMYFYSDLNNMLNNAYAASDRAKNDFKRTGDAAKKGEWKRSAKFAASGVGTVAGFMLTLSLVKAYENMTRGKENPFTDPKQDPKQFLKDVAMFYATSPTEIIDGIPLARDVKFAEGKYWEKKKTVDMPIDSTLGSFATAIAGIGNMLDEDKEVSSREKRELFKTFGILTKLPTDAIYNYLIKPDYEMPPMVKGTLERTSESIKNYLKRNEGNDKVPQQFKDDLIKIQNQIEPKNESLVPSNSLDVLKNALSKGDNLAYNEKTGAAGAYLFTEDQWNNIKRNAPDLGLTDNGRTSSDTLQQERAMDWQLNNYAENLNKNAVEVNNESLLASHLLGEKVIEVFKAPGDTKLKTLVGDKFLEDHGLKNSFKVRDFKDWLSQQIIDAENAQQGNN